MSHFTNSYGVEGSGTKDEVLKKFHGLQESINDAIQKREDADYMREQYNQIWDSTEDILCDINHIMNATAHDAAADVEMFKNRLNFISGRLDELCSEFFQSDVNLVNVRSGIEARKTGRLPADQKRVAEIEEALAECKSQISPSP